MTERQTMPESDRESQRGLGRHTMAESRVASEAGNDGLHVLLMPSWYPFPEAPHTGTFFREQAEMLQRSGMKVTVLAISGSGSLRDARRPLAVTIENNIRVVRAWTQYLPRGLRMPEQAILDRIVRDAYSLLGIEKPDVIHAHSALPGLLAARNLAQWLDVPLVFTEHRPSSVKVAKSGVRAGRIERAVRDAAARITVSEPFAEVLGDYYGTESFEVSPLPVSDDFFNVAIPERSAEPFTFIHVSHLAPGKQVPFLIETFAELARGRDLRLVVAGGDEAKVERLQRLVERLALEDKVSLLGPVERTALPGVMADADCFVLTSEKEAGGTVLSEARSVGLPIIVTDTWAGRHHRAFRAVQVVPVGDRAALLEAMKQAARRPANDEERTEIRERAFDSVSEAAFVGSQRRIYQEALARYGRQTMVFHAPYPIDQQVNAASRLRPLQMLRAFRSQYNVIEVVGYPADRRHAFRSLRRSVRRGMKVDFVYSENSTQPNVLATSVKRGTAPFLEAFFFFYLKAKGIPAGQFYRDIHWRYPDLTRQVHPLRRAIMRWLYLFDLSALKVAGTHIFLPSMEMEALLPRLGFDVSELPPGGDVKESETPQSLHLLYVGGLGPNYRLHRLLEAVAEVEEATLTLCVRESDWRSVRSEYEAYSHPRIEIVHRESNDLDALFNEARLCVLAVEPTDYWRIASPVKLFEYIGRGKPIIVSASTHAAVVVEQMGVGFVVPYSTDELVTALRKLAADPWRLDKAAAKAEVIRMANTWTARALEAAEVLTAQAKENEPA